MRRRPYGYLRLPTCDNRVEDGIAGRVATPPVVSAEVTRDWRLVAAAASWMENGNIMILVSAQCTGPLCNVPTLSVSRMTRLLSAPVSEFWMRICCWLELEVCSSMGTPPSPCSTSPPPPPPSPWTWTLKIRDQTCIFFCGLLA